MAKRYQNEELLREMYQESGMSTREIGEELGCSDETVRRYLEKFGIPRRNSEKTATETPEEHNDIELLDELYWGEGLSTREIAGRLGVSRETVRRRLNTAGRGTDKHRWARSLAPSPYTNKKGYEVLDITSRGESIRVRMHRLVALGSGEMDTSSFMDSSVIIHHKNGIPWDNRPENLEKMSQSDHTTLHNKSGSA